MSTSEEVEVACRYANSTFPLVLRCHARGLDRGVSIQYLSVFPKEKEFVYPPLTYLVPHTKKIISWSELCDKDEDARKHRDSLPADAKVFEVIPQMT
eukprot:2338957-Rhodomonas_salina.1